MDEFKKFLKERLLFIAISFSTCSLVWIIKAMISKIEKIPSIDFIYILAICIIGSFLEKICLSTKIFKQLSYTIRELLFMLLMSITFFAFALKANWLQIPTKEIIIRFVIVFIIGFTIIIVLDKIFLKEGEKYTQMLNKYKKENKKRTSIQ